MDSIFSPALTSTSDVLFSTQSLSEGAHTLTLTAHPTTGQQLAFENAVIYIRQVVSIASAVGSAVTNSVLISQAIPQMESYSNTNTTFLNYAGNWTTGTDAHIPGGTYHYTETMGSTISTSFKGSSAVVVQGIVNWGYWQYTVVRAIRLIPMVVRLNIDFISLLMVPSLSLTRAATGSFQILRYFTKEV